jgi:RimJ/RimL family protein N-acetyltransferase
VTVLETERLLLRRFREEDAPVVDAWEQNDDFKRYLGPPSDGYESIRRWDAHWDEHGFGLLAVTWRETGEPIGRSGVQYHRAWNGDPEVGWALDPRWWGRGLATEAGAASVTWAFGTLGFDRVVSICVEENVASRRVMEKLGFSLLKRLDWQGWHLWVHALDRPRGETGGGRR